MTRARVRVDFSAAHVGVQRGGARGLTVAMEYLLQVSRARVPLDEGTLERSGVASVDEEALKGAVSFDTPYAVRQHEDMTAQHAPGRTAKYLEGPAMAEASTIGDLIAAEVRREMR